MLAKLTNSIKNNKNWIYEMKYDGYRAITRVHHGQVDMKSRKGISFNLQYPPLIQELKQIKDDIVMDGEIVIENKNGISDFQWLQNYPHTQQGILKYYVFDLLFLNGHSVIDLPLIYRKELLTAFFRNYHFKNIIETTFIAEKGKELFEKLTASGYEGILAKDGQSKYFPGKCTSSWLKVKSVLSREAVIAGYTAPQNSRQYFGSLILGVYENQKMVYIGNCGSGFTEASLKALHEKFSTLETETCPFAIEPKMRGLKGKVTWLHPTLVCNIHYSKLTQDNFLRHPVFAGLRTDKKATEITQKIPFSQIKTEAYADRK